MKVSECLQNIVLKRATCGERNRERKGLKTQESQIFLTRVMESETNNRFCLSQLTAHYTFIYIKKQRMKEKGQITAL